MAATKVTLLCLVLTLPWIGAQAQLKKVTIKVNNRPVTEILHLVEAQTGVYFSYDPAIFSKEPSQSVNLVNVASHVVLDKILLPKFNYTLVGEYIVINLAKPKVVKQSDHSNGVLKQSSQSSVMDTIFIEKIIIKYDTQKIVEHVRVTDTVFINKVKSEKNKLQPASSKKHISFIPAVSIGAWNRSSDKESRAVSYSHTGASLSIEIPINKMTVIAGAGYSYLFKNFNYPSGFQNDSSNFPTDTVEIRYTSERINHLGFLSSHLGIGYSKKYKRIEIAFQVGGSFYFPVFADEKGLLQNGEIKVYNRTNISNPIINSFIRLPLHFYFSDNISMVMSSYFEYGLNQDYKNTSGQSNRYLYGMTIGLCKK